MFHLPPSQIVIVRIVGQTSFPSLLNDDFIKPSAQIFIPLLHPRKKLVDQGFTPCVCSLGLEKVQYPVDGFKLLWTLILIVHYLFFNGLIKTGQGTVNAGRIDPEISGDLGTRNSKLLLTSVGNSSLLNCNSASLTPHLDPTSAVQHPSA
jgi:hypothetical protein